MTKFTPIEVSEIPNNPKKGETFLIKGDGITDVTHGIFKYPCKFIPHIPRWFLNTYGNDTTKQYGVLDPFMGSGTTLVESSLLGYPAYGIDIDPLSKLLTQVKTTAFTKKEIHLLKETIDNFTLQLKKNLSSKTLAKFIPPVSSITYWFSEEAIADLAHIKYLIYFYDKKINQPKITRFLTITLASIIRKASKADEQSPKPYISKRITKKLIDNKANYITHLNKYFQAICQFSQKTQQNKIKIIGYDARQIDKTKIHQNQIHLAMTSPPYINAFDYVRSLKLENFWLSHITEEDLPTLYDLQIGTEKIKLSKYPHAPQLGLTTLDSILNEIYEKDKRRSFIVADFFSAMQQNMTEVYNVLLPKGYYCIVVGDSNIRNINTPTSRILIEIAKEIGFKLINDFSYIIRNRYLRIPRQGRGGFIPQDYVLVFEKS